MKEKFALRLEKIFLSSYQEWCLLSYTYLQNRIEAEEVVQDTCVHLLLNQPNKEIVNLKAYITVSIKNSCLKKIKQKKRFATLDTFKTYSSPSFEKDLIHKEKKLHIQKVVESLPASTKQVFKLCVFEDQKYQNVATTLGISVNTVKYHIKKAYKTLRVEIEDVTISMLISTLIFLS